MLNLIAIPVAWIVLTAFGVLWFHCAERNRK